MENRKYTPTTQRSPHPGNYRALGSPVWGLGKGSGDAEAWGLVPGSAATSLVPSDLSLLSYKVRGLH